jgi:predicted GNAT family N-acyltransferase
MNNNYKIKKVTNNDELIRLLRFADKSFYHLSIDEKYMPASRNFNEFKEQLLHDNDFLLYLENQIDQEIIGLVFGKNYNPDKQSITVGIIIVKNKYRNQKYGTYLIKEFENVCKSKGIKEINLCSRYKAINFYLKNDYAPHLFIQVYSPFITEDIKKANLKNYAVAFEEQLEFNGHICFRIEEVNKEDVEWFVRNVPTCNVQFYFLKAI